MLRVLLREPLVHFLIAGGLVFAAFQLTRSSEPTLTEEDTVVVSSRQAEQIAERFLITWGRSPTLEELEGLIETYVREEVLVREALSLSMDVGDSMIRRRLQQKMEFLIASAARSRTPREEELLEYLEANAEKYLTDARITFEQVFLGDDASLERVEEVIAALSNGQNPDKLARPSMLPPVLTDADRRSVDGAFGPGLFSNLETLEIGIWVGPLRSSFGVHAVRVMARQPSEVPALDEVRERVVADWKDTASKEYSEVAIDAIRSQYNMVLPTREELGRLVE